MKQRPTRGNGCHVRKNSLGDRFLHRGNRREKGEEEDEERREEKER